MNDVFIEDKNDDRVNVDSISAQLPPLKEYRRHSVEDLNEYIIGLILPVK